MRKPTKIQGPVTKLPIAHLYTKKSAKSNENPRHKTTQFIAGIDAKKNNNIKFNFFFPFIAKNSIEHNLIQLHN